MHSDFDAVEIYRISSDDGVPPKEPDPVRVDRHRGLWSFLTRTFFLGQLLAAQQMLSGSAHASQAEDAAAQRGDGSSEDAANPLPARESVSILADNGGTSEQLPRTGLTGQSQLNANPISADLGQPSSVEAATSLMQAGAGSGGGGAGSSAAISSSALARSPHEASGVHSPIIQLPIPVVDPDIDVGIDLPGISVQVGVGSGGVSAGIDVPGVIDAEVALPISTGEVLLPVIDVAAFGVDLTGDSGDISADALSTLGTVSELAEAATALSPPPPNLVEEIEGDLTGDAPDAVVDEALPGFSPAIDSPQIVSSSESAVELDTAAPVQTSLEQAIEPLGNETETGAVDIEPAETLDSTAEDSTAEDNTLSMPGVQPPLSSLTADVVSPGVIALADTGENGPSDMLFDTYSDLNIELQMEPGPFEPLQSVDTGADDLLPQLDAHDTSDTVQILPDLGRSQFADLFG